LFQGLTDLSIAVIASEKTNHKIQEVIEMTEVHDIPEMTEEQDHLMIENLVEVNLVPRNQEMISF
jgi:hypothetical protein